MEQKPGWKYSYAESLKMNIAVNEKTEILYTEDKIMYTKDESRLLRRVNYEIPLSVHIIKKVFGGTILSL